MSNNLDVLLDVGPPDNRGRRLVIARCGGVEHRDQFDTNSARARKSFLAELAAKLGVQPDNLAHLGDAIVAKADAADEAADAAGQTAKDDAGQKSQATRLVELAAEDELFHDADGHAYASIILDGCRQTWRVKSKQYRSELQRRHFGETRKAAGSQALQDALGTLEGQALHEGEQRRVAVRIAEHEGEVWLDLADDRWRAVRVSKDGWSVEESENVPVRFLRKHGMLPLPVPIHDGHIDDSRPLVNLPDDDAWTLFVAFLVGALHPSGPFPVLIVIGEAGSAKSTLCRVARELIDPNKAPLRRPPRDERDLVIAASNGWLLGFNNLSSMPDWLSDAVSVLVHDGGFGTRELYTDSEERIFDERRPVILNGIEDFAKRGDLLDRAIVLMLPVISDDQRCEERVLMARLREKRPAILGALLDGVVAALRNQAKVKLDGKPRLADLAVWVTAAEPALGWRPGTFMAAYAGNRGDANVTAVESSPVGPAVLALLDAHETWEGTATELLDELDARYADEKTRKQRDWPKKGKGMGSELRRIAPNLRAMGYGVTFKEPQGRKKRRVILLERQGKPRSATSASPADVQSQARETACLPRVADRGPADADSGQGTWPAFDGVETNGEVLSSDGADHADHPLPQGSGHGDAVRRWGASL
jgi:hypothetical protein